MARLADDSLEMLSRILSKNNNKKNRLLSP